VKTARFVLLRHSVGTSLLQIFLSTWMSASSFAGSPRCTFTLNRNVAAPAVVPFWSSSIASRKMFASGAPTNVAFPSSPTSLFLQRSAALCCRTNKLAHKNSLASCQRYRHSVESRALTCPFKHCKKQHQSI